MPYTSWRGAVTAALVAACLSWSFTAAPLLYDDKAVILENPVVTGSESAAAAWTVDFWGHNRLDSPLSHKSFRPLVTLWLRAEYATWGAYPTPYRVTNVALHALASALAVPVCFTAVICNRAERCGTSEGALSASASADRRHRRHHRTAVVASVAAVLFAAHPVHSEAIMHVAARADILSGILQFLALIVWARRA